MIKLKVASGLSITDIFTVKVGLYLVVILSLESMLAAVRVDYKVPQNQRMFDPYGRES